MKRLETIGKRDLSFFSRVLRAVITSASSLLTWTKMCLSVGFVIIMVVTLGALLDVLVRLLNYRNGTKLQTDLIFRDLLIYFSEEVVGQIDDKVELPPEFVSLANKNLPLSANRALRYLYKSARVLQEKTFSAGRLASAMTASMAAESLFRRLVRTGYPNYFIARSYVGHRMKYKNPRSSKNVVFNDLFTNWNNDLTIVEGVFDAITAGNSVPILGSTLRTDSDLLRKIVLNDTPCYIALDPDAAKKERRIIQTLLRYDVELYKIDVSGYEDIGAMPQEVFKDRKAKATFIDRDNYLLLDLLAAV